MPDPPDELLYIWQWYKTQLQRGEPLTWQELTAWSAMTARHIVAWESDLIISIDRLFHYGG